MIMKRMTMIMMMITMMRNMNKTGQDTKEKDMQKCISFTYCAEA